jgi:hypothetical protein
MKARLFFYDTVGELHEEIIETPVPGYDTWDPNGMSEEDVIAYIANNHLVEFVFDRIDAGVELL